MKKTVKLAIAGLVAALATTMGVAAPADAAKSAVTSRTQDCC